MISGLFIELQNSVSTVCPLIQCKGKQASPTCCELTVKIDKSCLSAFLLWHCVVIRSAKQMWSVHVFSNDTIFIFSCVGVTLPCILWMCSQGCVFFRQSVPPVTFRRKKNALTVDFDSNNTTVPTQDINSVNKQLSH